MIERTVRTKFEAEALANFLWNEMERHIDDIEAIVADLKLLQKKWGVEPKRIREFVRP